MSYLKEAYALPSKNNKGSNFSPTNLNKSNIPNLVSNINGVELPTSIFTEKWREHSTKGSLHFENANVILIANVILKDGRKLFDISFQDNTKVPYWNGFEGKQGVIYVYADDRSNIYREVFVEEYIKSENKIPEKLAKNIPGWFSYGEGPIARIAYEINGEQGVKDFIKWEESFTESARIYLTYKAPLFSDVIKISEAINGETLEGGIKLEPKERLEKLKSGIEGIITLWTGGAYGVSKCYSDSLIDHLIDENISDNTTKYVIKKGKKEIWKELDKKYKKK